jgi:hypothetical protein
MSDILIKQDEVYDSNAVTITLSNLKFTPNTNTNLPSINSPTTTFIRSSSDYAETFTDSATSEQLPVRKFSKLELHESSPKEELEEDESSRHYSESHFKKREDFRDFVKRTLWLETSRKTLNGKSLLPDNIANTIRDRITEAGMEKYADIAKRFESKYQILDYFLGEGSTGLVKKCLNKETRKFYAVKIIRSNDTEFLKAIKNEYIIQKHLFHPNIVRAYEMFYNPITSRVKIIMEVINGSELTELIQKEGRFTGTEF